MTGKIIKGIAGFYYVQCVNGSLYECKAKGNFRNKKIKPLVGDNVEIEILDEEKLLGNIEKVLPRKNCLLRPEVANVDQAVIIFAVRAPEPNFNLLTRFLIRMEKEEVPAVICFNKEELVSHEEQGRLAGIFADSGVQVIFTSTYEDKGLSELLGLLKNKTTVVAGPSGVGKSSIINCLCREKRMETGDISDKIKRGRHTTRHSELFLVDRNTFIMDTPGFTSLYLNEFDYEDLRFYFNEFAGYEGKCRFNGCVHINEPDCVVKEAVNAGKISPVRYENYTELYNELKSIRRY